MGFEPIFLIVEDVLNFARQTGVPFSSRGSAASSLVAHCLGITSPDPLRLNLYFERFLNPARATPPDIDTDLCSRRRDQVIKHVFDIYGSDRVAVVGTINRYRPKSALGDVAKAYGLSPAKVRELSNRLPHAWWARFAPTVDGKTISPFSELRNAYTSAQYQAIFDDAEAILKLPRRGCRAGRAYRPCSCHALWRQRPDHYPAGPGFGGSIGIGQDRSSWHPWSHCHG
jgi:DNA polymerase III alpha subunit